MQREVLKQHLVCHEPIDIQFSPQELRHYVLVLSAIEAIEKIFCLAFKWQIAVVILHPRFNLELLTHLVNQEVVNEYHNSDLFFVLQLAFIEIIDRSDLIEHLEVDVWEAVSELFLAHCLQFEQENANRDCRSNQAVVWRLEVHLDLLFTQTTAL